MSLPERRPTESLREAFHRLPMGAISVVAPLLLLAAGIASHHADMLRDLLPAVLFLLAWALFYHDRPRYMGFVLTVWLFTPLLRRLVDFSAGFAEPNAILLAPYLVTLVAPLCCWRSILRAPLAQTAPFLLCLFAILTGGISGFFHYQLTSVGHDALNWGAPVLFGAYLYTVEGESERFAAVLRQWFPPLLGICALYTVVQFCVAFPWDTAWLVGMDAPSMGSTDPFAMRAFGPLNSAGTAAFVFTIGTVYLLQLKGAWRLVLLAVTVLALVTTQVRAGWLALAVGVVLSLWRNPRRTWPAIVLLVALGAGLSAVGLGSDAAVISDRVQSFSHPSDDTSANGRMTGLGVAAAYLEGDPLGAGLGVPDDIFDIQGSFSLFDSSPADVFTTFGIVGIAYYLGLFALLLAAVRGLWGARQHEVALLTLPALTLLSISLLGSTTVAVAGFFIFALLSPAAHIAREEQRENVLISRAHFRVLGDYL